MKESATRARWAEVSAIIAQAEASGVEIGAAIIGPRGARFEHRGDAALTSASTIKIAVMLAFFRQVERGVVSPDDSYVLRDEDRTGGSGVLQHLRAGLKLSYEDVVYLMMSISDNPATNILIDLLGMENVNAVMRELGLEKSVLNRKMAGRPALPGELENLATANELALLVEAILDHKAASPASCRRMIALLEKQQNARRIGRYVPAGVRWGSKTGSYKTVANEAGFIESEAGRVVISVLTGKLPEMVAGEELISDIARAAMRATGVAEPAIPASTPPAGVLAN